MTSVAQKTFLIRKGLGIFGVFRYNFAIINFKGTSESENYRIEKNWVQPTIRADAQLGFYREGGELDLKAESCRQRLTISGEVPAAGNFCEFSKKKYLF